MSDIQIIIETKPSTYTANCKKYYEANKQVVNKKKLPHQAVYRANHREQLREYALAYYNANKDKVKAQRKLKKELLASSEKGATLELGIPPV